MNTADPTVRRASRIVSLAISIVAVLVLTFAVSGCGGGASSAQTGGTQPASLAATTTSPTTISATTTSATTARQGTGQRAGQAAVVAEANTICGQMNREFDADAPRSASIQEIARFSPHRAVLEARVVRELNALTPPASLAHDWRQMIGYRQTLARELAQLGRDAKANDSSGIRSLAATKKQVHAKLRALAGRDGLADCAQTG